MNTQRIPDFELKGYGDGVEDDKTIFTTKSSAVFRAFKVM